MSQRDRTLLAVVAVLAVLGGFWFGLAGPRRAELADVRAQVATARQAGDEALRRLDQGVAAKRSYAQRLAAMAELGKAVPDEADQAGLLYQLQDAAGRSRVAITAITPGGEAAAPGATGAAVPAAPAGIEPLPVTLSFEGSYRDLETFLRRVQTLTRIGPKRLAIRGRLLAVQAVTLTRDDQGSSRVSATIEAQAYVGAPAAPAAAPPADTTAPASVPGGAAAPLPTTPATIGAAG
jgi:Tfp pilus assembly protein PilO